MEQHKPKVDKLNFEHETTFSGGVIEDVIIHQPQDEQVLRAEGFQRMGLSFLMRLAGLLYGGYIASFFLRHYPGSNPLVIPPLQVLSLNGLLVLAFGAMILGQMIRRIRIDRQLEIPAILSNWMHLLFRPIFSYLAWTFVFFVIGALGNSGFAVIIGAVIALSGYDMKFKDRSRGVITFNSYSSRM